MLRARARDVMASGYAIGQRFLRPGNGPSGDGPRVDGPRDQGAVREWAAGLSAFGQARADRIVDSMTTPVGGIAAALLIGDRRYVSEATYDLFRGSGLAHLLAI